MHWFIDQTLVSAHIHVFDLYCHISKWDCIHPCQSFHMGASVPTVQIKCMGRFYCRFVNIFHWLAIFNACSLLFLWPLCACMCITANARLWNKKSKKGQFVWYTVERTSHQSSLPLIKCFCFQSLAEPCTVNDHDMRQNNIAFRFTHTRKLYAVHNDVITFRCTKGRAVGSMRQRCNDGVILLPSCQ